MKLVTGPWTLPGGGHVTIPLPTATLLVRAVVLGNLTPAPVTVTIAGQTSNLLPATANLYVLSSGSQGIVVTSLGTTKDAGQITTEWMTPATVPTTGYPIGGAITNLTLGPDSTVKITGPVSLAVGSSVKLTGPITISSGKVTVSGGQLTRTGYSLQYTATTLTTADLGNGTTGTVTITADATRTSDMNAKNLTVKATVTLHTGGYRILVQETAQITGTVANVGTNANGTTIGAGAPSGTLLGGGTGGATSTKGGTAPRTTNALAGGHGGKGTGGQTGGNPSSTIRPPASISISYLRSHVIGGGGGGGGTAAATTAAGGGGGGGLWLAANTLAGTGTIRATGGAGGKASPTRLAGGGGGGAAIVACRKVSFSGSVKAAGGSLRGQPGTAALLVFS